MTGTTGAEIAELRTAVREFGRREIAPHVATYDREERFPAEIVRKTAALGWIGAVVPPEYGGAGLSWRAFAAVIEEVSRFDHIVGLAMSMPSGLVGGGILRYGTHEQKKLYVEPLVRGETFGGAGVTEPGSGTAVSAMSTRYRREGDEFVLSGAKAWISMLDCASWFLTFATSDPRLGRHGVSAFIVHRDSPGLTLAPYKNKLGFRPVSTGDLVLDEVRVPADRMVGEEGGGYQVAMAAVESGRLSVAARAVGLSQACLDASVSYARQRKVLDTEIGRYQLVQSMITDMVVGIEGARHFVTELAEARDAGVDRPRRSSSLSKMHATDVAMTAATHAVQIHGAYGVSEDYPVGRYFRDAKVFQIIEGNNQMHRAMVAEYALGYRSPDT